MSNQQITLKRVVSPEGAVIDVSIPSDENTTLSAEGLTLLPALVDPHAHCRTPGLEHKENWVSAARAALYGGVTTLFDMPNTLPPSTTLERIEEKHTLIRKQLKEAGIPLDYGLYLGADKNHFDEIIRCKRQIVGIKVFMGSSTGGLVMDDESSLHAAFSLAAAHDLLLAVHAEDEALIHERTALFPHATDPKLHSEIRNAQVALRATEKAIALARLYRTRLYILHVSTKREVEAIAAAKKEGLSIYAETTPHHLFLTTDDYAKFGTKVQMNPPLRSQEDVDGLWKGIERGIIDTIGSDHAPHTLEEKARPYGQAPSGVPGLETTLPLLLDACNRGRLSLKQIIHLTREKVLEIFRYPSNDDYVLVDLKKKKKVDDTLLHTKCRWSPFAGRELHGWPVYTILKGKIYELK